MAYRSAQERVCTIPELVENILLQANFSPLELVLSRGINRTFNDVILNALPFRRALFLDAVDDGNGGKGPHDAATVEVNPLLEGLFPKHFEHYFDVVLRHEVHLHGYDIARETLVSQSSVCKRCYSNSMDLAGLPDEGCYLHLPMLETSDEEDYFPPGQRYEGALWRRMYATRPVLPVHAVDATPIAHRWEIAPGTLGEIFDRLVVGKVVFGAGGA